MQILWGSGAGLGSETPATRHTLKKSSRNKVLNNEEEKNDDIIFNNRV
jgi:hypothetical protein